MEELRKLCESPFEREVYDELTQRGYRVTPQVKAGPYRIDMVVEGHHDVRLAVECDGDKYHGPDKWVADMTRELNLRRAGWGMFWRCFASAFVRRRQDMLDDLIKTLSECGIEPIGAEGAPKSVHTEHRIMSSVSQSIRKAEVWPVENPVSLQPPRPDIPLISSISSGEDLNQPREPLKNDSDEMKLKDVPNRPEFDERDTSGITITTMDKDQRDVSNAINLFPSIDAGKYNLSMKLVKEEKTVEFVLKKVKETKSTWVFKENKDENPIAIYLTKDRVKELSNPTSIIITIKAA